MGNENSVPLNKLGSENMVSSYNETAVPKKLNGKMLQSYRLIWLDSSIIENRPDHRHTLIQLQSAVGTFDTFNDGNEFIRFIKSIDNEKVYLIT